jgi:N-methylhydantoinase A/oxoprolinase/acetone carboxylase beta subunit
MGPAIVEQPDTTTFVPSGWELTCDAYGNLDLRRETDGSGPLPD